MNDHQSLLAKTIERHQPVPHLATLVGHLKSVHAAAETVLQSAGNEMLNAFGLPAEFEGRFHQIVAVAAAVHDVGKANDHFLGMLTRSQDRASNHYQQALRHEWLSWWWLHQPAVRKWIESVLSTADDWYIVLCCVAGHHPKTGRNTPPNHAEGSGSTFTFLLGHPDFNQITEWLTKSFCTDTAIPPVGSVTLKAVPAIADDIINQIQRQVMEVQSHIDDLDRPQRYDWPLICASAKACLVAADVAGSALSERLTEINDHKNWIADSLKIKPKPSDIEQLVAERLGKHDERPFQTEVANTSNRVSLVTAGCGSGKTVAAWLWAARQCPNQRVYFCYPTTGTATEGFRGYLFDDQTVSTKLGAKLFHSRAPIDFDIIMNAEQDEDEDDTELQIASLQSWGTPLVCCTVDTVLGIMQNQRRGLYAWPALAQAAYVFDEIHAYDDKLFGCLLQFLDKLRGLRVLLMTASLPVQRLKAIESILADQNDTLRLIRGPKELEQLPRYRNDTASTPFTPQAMHFRCEEATTNALDNAFVQKLIKEIESGGRVLWICNIVDRAMVIADIFAEVNPLIYHSRFRYEDRVNQHKAVVDAFDRNATKGCLAICTQVAEMSLDISATRLVSEICPVPSLIQRLGRLNRHATPPKPGQPQPPTLPFIIVAPVKSDGTLQVMPYAEKTYGNWPQQTHEWLNHLGDRDICQQALAKAWEQLFTDTEDLPLGNSTWIEGGPITQVDSLRKSLPSVTVVLPGPDAERVATKKSELTKVAISMPPPSVFDWKSWQTASGYIVPPTDSITYSRNRGAQWVKP